MNHWARILTGLAFAAVMATSGLEKENSCAHAADILKFRPPAVPLVTSDPYLSIWSEADRLTDDTTRHWTHREHPLVSLIRVDGKAYRLMGVDPKGLPAFPQVGLEVTPTRSIYDFDNGQVHVKMTFLTAALPHDLDALSRPLSYITWTVRSHDGMSHAVSIYDSASSEIAVEAPTQKVTWKRLTMGPLTALRVGTVAQTLFKPAGDDTRIDWGYAYVAAPTQQAKAVVGGAATLENGFVTHGKLPATDDSRSPRAANDDTPVLAFTFALGNVGAAGVSRHVTVAYDEVYSILYFRRKLMPYWRKNFATASALLQAAERDYPRLTLRCEEFDRALMGDLTKVGGARYAHIASLAYRECLAGVGIAEDANKQPLLFTKENTSNGDIATVDVIFPMDPMFVLLSPTLAKASLVPILSYAASSHWKFPNAPHDLGTYPVARGTDDGGEGMPVEESGNMLILCDAIAQEEGNANFVTPWWPKLTQWAKYLEAYGLDPEDQLCTDDFMGHLAHNSNLSIKAIIGLAAYGDMCRMRGDTANATRYRKLAKADAMHWVTAAGEGNHSRLAFDQPNTWSQKYNLVWDHILHLDVFPPSVAQKESAYYIQKLQPFGVPLDSRTHLTKTDWSIWSATLADNKADFETLVGPIYDYLNQTGARMPLVDSYITDNINSDGMHARPVVGGLFVKMLSDPAMWKKWSSGDHAKVGGWVSLPPKPDITEVVPTSKLSPFVWQYTNVSPGSNWFKKSFDASTWKSGPAPIGTIPGSRTPWTDTPGDLWIRRAITLPPGAHRNLQFSVFHDEDVEIYVDGVLAAEESGYNTSYEPMEIRPEARALLKPGATVTIAAHVHQTTGGQGIDIGLADVVEH